jgi:ketosteroid isomerase-like protein
VRVPTEGEVGTTHVILDVPLDVTVLEVVPTDGATFEVTRQGARITAITWKKEIAPKAAAEFVFRARNPATGEIVWKAHQHFSDGTVADWVGPAGDRRPAAVTKLISQAAATGTQNTGDTAAAVEAWLRGYDAAFNAKDLERLANFYHPDVTIYEGGGVNNGWIDYRDRHLGPELKSFDNLQFGHTNVKVTILPGGQSAYATSEYAIKAKMGERLLDTTGLETLVLVKAADGTWKIRHSHTSSRARRPAA